MNDFTSHFYFGTIARPVALKGEMVVRLNDNDTSGFEELEAIFIDINAQLIPFFLKNISFRKLGEAVIEVDGITSIEATKEFIKKDIYLSNDLLPEVDEGDISFNNLIGFNAVDKHFGAFGIVKGILNFPQQNIFQIEFQKREILIPAIDAFIFEINKETKTITFSSPEGLIELYLTDNHKDD